MSEMQKRDLTLFPGQFALMQDTSKGNVKLYTGPANITPTTQERPVIYDVEKRTFLTCETLEAAVRLSSVAVEGYYIELLNPSKDGAHPNDSAATAGPDLLVGRKINIPGPAMFALWPGQVATVIRGHHLRSNQFLLARVYNEEEARKNWSKAIVKRSTSNLTPPASTATEEEKKAYDLALTEEKKNLEVIAAPPKELTVGMMFIIRGTEVSFYIPPTGITVVPESKDGGNSVYAREALTLERLEYTVLIDESGNKRFEKGPTVVFPKPTERFTQQKDDRGNISKKFTAIEMNQIQGIHIKVTADYEENGKKFKAGEELFITGKDTPIYYPREEHAAIKYDGKTKHFATAIPAGEARYVMNRMTGEIRTVVGETMLLPDPRTEIIVRRVLSDKQVSLWYPGNVEALEYNRSLRVLLGNAPTTRTGVLSEGDVERGGIKSSRMRGVPENKSAQVNYASVANNMMAMDSSQVSKEQGYIGDEVVRASSYTAPRSITLEGKYQGVPSTELWTNYGVMVVSKTGERRVEVGPKTLLLAYDESLEVLELSSGKPKTTDNLLKTVYLRVENNKVSDIISVETSDHVVIQVSLSYRVNFEGDSDKWFAVENYIKFLCDHVRSVLKGAVRKIKVEDFYSNSTDILQDTILGAKEADGNREGMFFKENNMRIADVEVLGVTIQNPTIRQLLEGVQHDVVKANIEVTSARRTLEVTKEKEAIDRETARQRFETFTFKNDLEKGSLASTLALTLNKIANKLTELEEQKQFETEEQALLAQRHTATLAIRKTEAEQLLALQKEEQEQTIVLLKAEAEAVVSRFKAVDGNFSSALLTLSNNETLQKVAEAWNIQRAIGGDSVSDALSKVFSGTPLAGLVKQLTSGPITPSNGASKASVPAQS